MKVPSLAVDATIVELNTPPLNNSILTFSTVLSVQVISCEVPMSQISSSFGDVTVIVGVKMLKLTSDRSVTVPVVVLVITTV